MRINRLIPLILCLALLGACAKNPEAADPAPPAAPQETEPPKVSGTISEYPQEAYDDYLHDIAADRETFDFEDIDIVVGDKLYMTQINDWYMNFGDYANKSVELEGYYMTFDKYAFVGRFGPSCPYCTGGYVNFEFHTDEELPALVSERSWVRVTGILREGRMYPGGGEEPMAFYYIEAMKVEELPEVGLDTVTD
ncbi:MAG TPA: hypothetical protein VN446_01525 [Candidatus Acidoferrum sp.]|nr:hypothetical protein [Candidatus Acidoferrum sp.]